MTLHDQAQAIANSTGLPAFIVHPVYSRPYIARTPQAVEPGFSMLSRVLPHGYSSLWKP